MIPAINNRVEEFRRAAAAARNHAISNPAHRDEFLTVAENWEALAREAERAAAGFSRRIDSVRI